MFTHINTPIVKRPFVEQMHSAKGHFYKTENGDIYPSITTVQHAFPNPGIDAWKQREPNWQQISKSSTDVGTALHSLAEDYLNNVITYEEGIYEKNPNELFQEALKPHLDEHVNNIYGTETKLYSDKLRLAGTVDCVAEYNGVLSVIDFKNSRKTKTPSNMRDSGYFEQATAYSLMWEFCLKQKVEQAVILVCSWDNKCRAFEIKIEDYFDRLMKKLCQYEILTI